MLNENIDDSYAEVLIKNSNLTTTRRDAEEIFCLGGIEPVTSASRARRPGISRDQLQRFNAMRHFFWHLEDKAMAG
jgi:hypothetical protein